MIILGDMHPSPYISGFIFDDVVGKTGILRFRLYIGQRNGCLSFTYLFASTTISQYLEISLTISFVKSFSFIFKISQMESAVMMILQST